MIVKNQPFYNLSQRNLIDLAKADNQLLNQTSHRFEIGQLNMFIDDPNVAIGALNSQGNGWHIHPSGKKV